MKHPTIQVTGAVTFYNSPVHIADTSFSDSTSEDSLNIFRSRFSLENVTFQDAKSDALDVDFADGEIRNSRFHDIGNDALDFSGSNVTIDGLIISNSFDKVISAGEKSRIDIKNIQASNSSIGLTSKDSSSILAENILFNDLDVCLSAFNKKDFFEGGNIQIDAMPTGCDVPYLLESASSLTVDKRSIHHNSNDVESLMYGRKFGKATQK